jgi:hypothetical protein
MNTAPIPHVELDVNNFSEFLFQKNHNDAQVYIELDGIEDTKDMFFFCLDLFCKGLVQLFGKDSRVNLDDLTIENFNVIKKKLKNAGILVNLNIYVPNTSSEDTQDTPPVEDSLPENQVVPPSINIDHIQTLPNDLKLNEYVFNINTPTIVYSVYFELIHNVPS